MDQEIFDPTNWQSLVQLDFLAAGFWKKLPPPRFKSEQIWAIYYKSLT